MLNWLKRAMLREILEDLKSVEEEIFDEIINNNNKPNTGKIGCLRRIQGVINKYDKL